MPRFLYRFQDGPFDGHEESADQPMLEIDLQRKDPRTGGWHHYALVQPLPDFTNDPEPYDLHYRHVQEFDPDSDYLEKVAELRSRKG